MADAALLSQRRDMNRFSSESSTLGESRLDQGSSNDLKWLMCDPDPITES
jgi:hypothetical protein